MRLVPLLGAPPIGVASLVGLLWARACFRRSCRHVGPCGLPQQLLGMGALSGVIGAGVGVAISSASLEASLRFLGTFSRGRVLLGGHPLWRSASAGAGSAALGRHSLAHGCGDCWWCHDEAH